jgi:hypothetical protein
MAKTRILEGPGLTGGKYQWSAGIEKILQAVPHITVPGPNGMLATIRIRG